MSSKHAVNTFVLQPKCCVHSFCMLRFISLLIAVLYSLGRWYNVGTAVLMPLASKHCCLGMLQDVSKR